MSTPSDTETTENVSYQDLVDAVRAERKANDTSWTAKRILGFAVLLLSLNMFGMTVMAVMTRDIQNIQQDREGDGDRTRAVACRLMNALELELDDLCLEPEILRHYDPYEITPEASFRSDLREVLCNVERSLESAELSSICEKEG